MVENAPRNGGAQTGHGVLTNSDSLTQCWFTRSSSGECVQGDLQHPEAPLVNCLQ